MPSSSAPVMHPILSGLRLRLPHSRIGRNPVQEIACAYAIAAEYIKRGLGRGPNVDDFAGQISFNLDIFGNFLSRSPNSARRGAYGRGSLGMNSAQKSQHHDDEDDRRGRWRRLDHRTAGKQYRARRVLRFDLLPLPARRPWLCVVMMKPTPSPPRKPP